MLERVIEDWLISVGERGFETAFSQLLIAENYRVLHHPAHHPYEHGKDIAAWSQDGKLCGFQLKGGNLDLAGLEVIQSQLFALAVTALAYPGVSPPRRPDRVFLVTTGRLTPPARSRLEAINDGNRSDGLPVIECVEREQLLARLLAAHGRFLVETPAGIKRLLELYVADGAEPLPVQLFAKFCGDVLQPGVQRTVLEHRRALARCALTASVASAAWRSAENHLAVTQAWLIVAGWVLHAASSASIPLDDWEPIYDTAMQLARESISSLVAEAAQGDDLVVPDLVDGVVYPVRAVLVCGYSAAAAIAGLLDEEGQRRASAVMRRELPLAKLSGEAGVPHLLLCAVLLERSGAAKEAAALVCQLAKGLAGTNQKDSEDAIPGPYHSLESHLERMIGAAPEIDERFDGYSYTLHILIEWLARRDARGALNALWPIMSRISCCEFNVSSSAALLLPEDDQGDLRMWQLPTPASWKALRQNAGEFRKDTLPIPLWQKAEFLPFWILLFPYRLTSAVAKALDFAIFSRGTMLNGSNSDTAPVEE